MDFRAIYHRVMKMGLEVLGLYYSSYIGFVVDNEDPKSQKRLKIIVPSIFGPTGQPVNWAYPKSQYSGKNCGTHILPQIGEAVMVEFLNGKLTNPVWTWGWSFKDQLPEEFKSPKTYGFKSPAGYLVIIDDFDKVLKALTPNGTEISMFEDTITIKTPVNTITLDKNGTTIDSGEGDVYVSNDKASISITDAGVDIDSSKGIFVGGQMPVLYSKVPGATVIVDVAQIGVSTKVKVG